LSFNEIRNSAVELPTDILSRRKRDDSPNQAPEQPSMYPRPGAAALMALLAGLANNQFRPDDDPFAAFMQAYQGAKNDQYERAKATWENQNPSPPPHPEESPKDKPWPPTPRNKDLHRQYLDDYQSAVDTVRANLPPTMQPHAADIAQGIHRAHQFLGMQKQTPPSPEVIDDPLTPIQSELSRAIHRSEMLHQMIDGLSRQRLNPGHRAALDDMVHTLKMNEDVVNKLFALNELGPNVNQQHAIMIQARRAIDRGADPTQVHNRTRNLLVGAYRHKHPSSYFDDLV